jgi:flagellar hook capping protein FlgD
MKIKHQLILGAVALTAAFTLVAFPLHGVFAAKPSASERTTALETHDLWRKLWEDHITWTRVVIISDLDQLPGNAAYQGRLIQNYEDMEDALKPYYGDDAEELGDLIQEHLLIAVEILEAARTNDTASLNDAKARWYANGHDLAVKMSEMNPQFWPLGMGDPMWKDHLDATFTEAVDHLTGDFAGEVAAYDQIVDLAMDMADFISNGMMLQFRDSFSGIRCVLGQNGRNEDHDGDEDDQGEDNDEQSVQPTLMGFHAQGGSREGARTFQFQLTQNGPVSLAIYDLSGRQVATVFQGSLEAGPHEITWNGRVSGGSSSAAGIYFARITAGTQSQALKLVEIKP